MECNQRLCFLKSDMLKAWEYQPDSDKPAWFVDLVSKGHIKAGFPGYMEDVFLGYYEDPSMQPCSANKSWTINPGDMVILVNENKVVSLKKDIYEAIFSDIEYSKEQ